jgi:hypothetical protein
MTYPDLVPAISGFTELLFIKLMTLLFSLAYGSDLIGTYSPPFRMVQKDIVSYYPCPEFPVELISRTGNYYSTISGQRL